MSESRLFLIDPNELNQTTVQHCLDIVSLVNKYRPNDRKRNQATAEQILKNVASNSPLLGWDETFIHGFMMMSYSLCRDDVLQSTGPGAVTQEGNTDLLRGRAAWLCSLALHHPSVDSDTRVQGIGLWVMTMLNTDTMAQGPQEFIESILEVARPFVGSENDLADQIKLQFVIYLANRLQIEPEPVFSIDLAREWCSYLITRPKTRKLIHWAAGQLKVEIPATAASSVPSSTESVPASEKTVEVPIRPSASTIRSVPTPEIWPVPNLIPVERIQTERIQLISAIRGHSSLSERTRSQINRLNANSDNEVVGRYFHYAFRDLWRAYWTEGNRKALELADAMAIFMLSANQVEHLDTRKGQVLHLWMNCQLPTLIYTCDLEDLVQDAIRLATFLKEPHNQAILFAGIVQAHAGESKRLALNQELERRVALLRDNRASLEKLHRKYRELVGSNDRDEELPAWESMFASEPSTNSPNSPNGLLNPVPGADQPAIQTILDDVAFRDVMRLGSHEQTHVFVANNLDRILELLRRRLDVRIGIEFVMQPEGEVYQPGAARSRQTHPEFLSGKMQLERGRYDDAQRIFEKLIGRVSGLGAEIARNYLAYALARQGDPVSARLELRRLFDSNSPYASVYWNYACCLPAEELDKKLEAFFVGLERAPHPRLLHGAVYLASLKSDNDDSRLRDWLPVMTHAESLLWLYLIEYERLDFDGRDAMFLRLGQYVRKGEPNIPNPLDREILGDRLADVLPTLMERNQARAIEFWLRCRERVARDRFDYWELRTDFLEQSGKKKEAVESFTEELRRRIGFLSNRIQRNASYPKSIVDSTSRRVDHWLRLCMIDELHAFGQRIFDDITSFEKAINGRVQITPRDRRIREHYGVSTVSVPPGSTTTSGSSSSIVRQQETPLSQSTENMDTMLARVGGICKARLHELRQLPQVRPDLDRLIYVLKAQGALASAVSLTALLEVWGREWPRMRKDERQQSLDRARASFAEFRSNMQRELRQSYNEIAIPLFEALSRVNDHLARTASLLPHLVAASLTGQPTPVDLSKERTAFAVRLMCQPGDPPVRIKKVEATLEDDFIALPVRDRFDTLNIILAPDHPVLLNIEVAPRMDLSDPHQVRLDVTYEFSGSDYVAAPVYTSIQAKTCPPLPDFSPYVYGRPLQADEIERLFVGRDEEQQAVLMSISNGQQVVRYIEGIRRVGKSSLLRSIEYKVRRLGLPLIPVHVAPDSVNDPGLVLHNLLKQIAEHPEVSEHGVGVPDEERCKANPTAVYEDFQRELGQKIPDRRVVALLDDFQELVVAASVVRERDPIVANVFRSILNKIRQLADPNARLLWVFSGQVAREQYRKMLPNVLFWGDMISLPIAFLDRQSIGEILKRPLALSPMVIPDETVDRLHFLTAGHPECAQQMAEYMLKNAVNEKRLVITPADADEAARDLAETQDNFADTWYPQSELTSVQKEFVASFIQSVPLGGRIEPFKLSPDGRLTDAQKTAIDDLVLRRILEAGEDGRYAIKAYVLELWLRRMLPRLATENVIFNGSVAIFVDVANLTSGTGDAVVSDLDTEKGEGNPGRFSLRTILGIIERYADSLSPVPVAAHYAVNYPKGSPAVVECNAQGYYIENIPEALWNKGSDDHVLSNRISDVEQGYPLVNHYLLVTGDKDYRHKIEGLLKKGKYVHVVSRARSLSRPETPYSYDYLAQEYPARFTLKRLEELLEANM